MMNIYTWRLFIYYGYLQILSMGFDRTVAEQTLRHFHNNVNQAVDDLLKNLGQGHSTSSDSGGSGSSGSGECKKLSSPKWEFLELG